MTRPHALLVVGIHREERAFGEAVAARLDRTHLDVLVVPEGLSGKRPRQDQRFHFDLLHKALYRQLTGHMEGKYALLIDLHAGQDEAGLGMEIYSRDAEALGRGLAVHYDFTSPPLRLIRLGHRVEGSQDDMPAAAGQSAIPSAATPIPREVWDNLAFRYIGLEVFLPPAGGEDPELLAIVAGLIEHIAAMGEHW